MDKKLQKMSGKGENVQKKCEHGNRKSYCKDCGGSSICQRDRIRSQCKDCGSAEIGNCGF